MDEGGRESQIQTYGLATDSISSLWLCGEAEMWKQPGVSSPVYANGPR